MPDKKTNVVSLIFGVFQKKKPPCDDIVTAADKVIEEYIFCKNKLIRSRHTSKSKRETALLSCILITVILTMVAIYFISS